MPRKKKIEEPIKNTEGISIPIDALDINPMEVEEGICVPISEMDTKSKGEETIEGIRVPVGAILEEVDAEDIPVSNNGHDKDVSAELLMRDQDNKAAEDALRRMREEQEEQSIPAGGYLVNVRKKWLPEVTILNHREIFSFAVGHTQDAVVQPDFDPMKRSVWDIFEERVFRLKISGPKREGEGGTGRDDLIAVEGIRADKQNAAMNGGMTGGPA